VTALLEVESLSVDIPLARNMLHAVRDVSFTLAEGETLCLVGESGCGKSLTALAVMGLLPETAVRRAARLAFDGIDLAATPERRLIDIRGDRMAIIFQDPMTSLNPSYTVGNQLVEIFLRHRPQASRRAARARAIEMLEKVGIHAPATRLGQYPHQLSGGLRQRVMIAMALMCEPELIIADEPTTALDVTIQAQILRLLADLRRELGLTMLLITHDLGVVASVADRVAVMYAGRIVESGTVDAVFAQPRHPYTRGLMQCIPVPGVTGVGAPLRTIPGNVPSLVGDIVGCAFRDRCPERLPECAATVRSHVLSDAQAYECNLAASAA
jgi:peptide/nickel transport system ATP-binding protein